jgi:rubrerythrin
MSLLRTEPPAPVRSLDELFALARALEDEAATRYAALAERMGGLGLPEVAEVFRTLAIEERGHAEQVEGWARAVTGAGPDPSWIRWHPPETFDEEEARSIVSSSLASAYRALSMAVRNEERAFALWSYIAAQAEDPAIQAAAERMAGEELRHAALLRRERRRAFHAERGQPVPATPRPPPAEEAARNERALAALLSTLAGAGAGHAAELRRLSAEADGMAGEAAAAASATAMAADAGARARHAAGTPSAGGGPAPEGLPGALRLAERSVEAYLDAADLARDEQAMRQLQSLAERAIARSALLRRIAGQA